MKTVFQRIRLAHWMIATLLLSGVSAQAQENSWLRRLLHNRIEFEVRVTDVSGRPLAGATIWLSEGEAGLETGNPDVKAMERMAERYAILNDFLNNLDLPGTVIKRVDSLGVYHYHEEFSRAPSEYAYRIAALKRGYIAKVVAGTAQMNREHVVEITLQRDPQSVLIDPRMEEFDQMMMLAHTTLPGESFMDESRMQRLQETERRLRSLAQDIEKDGRGDDASAIYWALASFPEVKTMVTSDGGTRIVGYSSDRAGAVAEDDQRRAIQLNSRVPKLMLKRDLVNKGFDLRFGIRDGAHGRAFLRAFEAIHNSPLGNRMTLFDYAVAMRQAVKWESPDYACAFIQRAFRFEPFILKSQDWHTNLSDVAKQRERMNLPPQHCRIEGLPPMD